MSSCARCSVEPGARAQARYGGVVERTALEDSWLHRRGGPDFCPRRITEAPVEDADNLEWLFIDPERLTEGGIDAPEVAFGEAGAHHHRAPRLGRHEDAASHGPGIEDLKKRWRHEEGAGEVGTGPELHADFAAVHGTHSVEHGPVPRDVLQVPPESRGVIRRLSSQRVATSTMRLAPG